MAHQEINVDIITNCAELIPKYQTHGSSGCDLYANVDRPVELFPNETTVIPTGISLRIPKGYEAQIRPRSGLAIRERVMAMFGTIDQDYTDEIKVILYTHGINNCIVRPMMRIAQLVFCPVTRAKFIQKDKSLPIDIKKRHSGFGSTGYF